MVPVVDGLQQTYSDRIQFVVYKDANASAEVSDFAMEQGVQYVPTMMLVSADGVELDRWVGAVAERELRGAFDQQR